MSYGATRIRAHGGPGALDGVEIGAGPAGPGSFRLAAPGRPIKFAVAPEFPALGDWCQAVCADPFFFGIEFPAARSTATAEGAIELREYPGMRLEPGGCWTSHAAVAGCAASGSVESTFLKYVGGLDLEPPAPSATVRLSDPRRAEVEGEVAIPRLEGWSATRRRSGSIGSRGTCPRASSRRSTRASFAEPVRRSRRSWSESNPRRGGVAS